MEATGDALRDRIAAALPGSSVRISCPQGGHWVIEVVAADFAGLGTLQRQRRVYSAIKDLMSGEDAPVHAVDRLTTRSPTED
jgi:stress-induced morphogen